MPRANRFHLPGYVWHLTHRCHDRRFLLRFARDRRAWIGWLFEARRRFGLCVLDYQVTSNHVHLVVRDRDQGEIADSMQLLEGSVASAYNRRKQRLGGYWQDRYSATAVETGEHLWGCMAYVDLNMVRAGVVDHPRDWPHAGYHEIVRPKERYKIVDRDAVCEVLEIGRIEELSVLLRSCRERCTRAEGRDERWTKCVAVGSRAFVQSVAEELGARALRRTVRRCNGGGFVLREPDGTYNRFSGAKTRSKA